jgi:beta-glucosidase
MRRFADIARQEYRAVGIHMTLSPQADLATEPRWSRINATFGEDADLAGSLVTAYVEGFQHGRRGTDSSGVLAVVKHWVGYGASQDGYDGHNYYGRYAPVSGNALSYHVRPFLGAFAANVAGVMPTYAILPGATIDGRPLEQVGAGFNRQLITDLLRTRHRFGGIVLTDWAVTNDCSAKCRDGVAPGERPSFADVAMPWGVETLPRVERFAKAVHAGVDQFGGTEDAAAVAEAVTAGRLVEARLDSSVVRIMAQKFALGLFENPYVDPIAAQRLVGNEAFRAAALEAQRRALVLLENKGRTWPLGAAVKRVFLHRIDPLWPRRTAGASSPTRRRPTSPSCASMPPSRRCTRAGSSGRCSTKSTGLPGRRLRFRALQGGQRQGPDDRRRLPRPTGHPHPLKERAKVLLPTSGSSDAALLDVIAGRDTPRGVLPFALPASMESVAAQRGDRAHDLTRPLYRFGAGMRR